MYFDISLALKQEKNDKLCMAVSAAMAFNTTPEDFVNCMKNISIEFKNVRTEPGFGLLELKIFALKFDKDIIVKKGSAKDIKGPCVIVVHSERHANILHAIYMDAENSLHDPNPTTDDGRDILSYRVVEWYQIVPFHDD